MLRLPRSAGRAFALQRHASMRQVHRSIQTSAEIREAFLQYFEKHGHTRVVSSGLVPSNDPSLLFTNAGMVQFKDTFLGREVRPYKTATTVQKCVRAGGKHNDLDNVGFTRRHHTFFEMLGNFSFGDYSKEQAIRYAWDFVTNVLKLPKDKLQVSVYLEDDEAAAIWHEKLGLPHSQIVRKGKEDNFWSMGDGPGPCGPCTEIFWDQGREVDGDRWLEIWNVVFMEFMKTESGELKRLDALSIDTGMGLERVAAVLQSKPSNFDIDSMGSIIDTIQKLITARTGRSIPYEPEQDPLPEQSAALRVICDHLRSISFLIADGVVPSAVGRGYVLRRILRRAVRYGHKLGLDKPFLADLLPSLVSACGSAYPELIARSSVISQIATQEEAAFFTTLDRGLKLLEDAFKKLSPSNTELSGDVVFKLYDTYGFPTDLTAIIAKERGCTVDMNKVDALMQQQRERARAAWKGNSGAAALPEEVRRWSAQGVRCSFTGYDRLYEKESTVRALCEANNGAVWITLDPCPFYPEGGGQIGDVGQLQLPGSGKWVQVLDTRKPYEGAVALLVDSLEAGEDIDLVNTLKVGTVVTAQVDQNRRKLARSHHTTTHLLHAALRNLFGEATINQAGSLVTHERFRFDFTFPRAMTKEELQSVEDWVNKAAESGASVRSQVMPLQNAMDSGAVALFTEKYADEVRVVEIEGLSKELCGGTHVASLDEVYPFHILSEGSVAANTRRIEAVSGRAAVQYLQSRSSQLERVASTLRCSSSAQVEDKAVKAMASHEALRDSLESFQRNAASYAFQTSSSTTQGLWNGKEVVIRRLSPTLVPDMKALKEELDAAIRSKPAAAQVVVCGHKITVAANPSTGAVSANDLLKYVLKNAAGSGKSVGRGGGSPQSAQGSLPEEEIVSEAWDRIVESISEKKA